jgi:hypothetical protein
VVVEKDTDRLLAINNNPQWPFDQLEKEEKKPQINSKKCTI